MECGLSPDNPNNLPDWGRGCAQECSRILCKEDEIYDWTDPRKETLHRCKQCSGLTDSRLCTTADHERYTRTSDVSGNRPLIKFDHCQGKNSDKTVTYGTCTPCVHTTICATPGTYAATCPSKHADDSVCLACVARDGTESGRTSWYLNGTGYRLPAYCQVLYSVCVRIALQPTAAARLDIRARYRCSRARLARMKTAALGCVLTEPCAQRNVIGERVDPATRG